MSIQARAEGLLCNARLYRPARNTYQRVLNQAYWRERVQARAFFESFVSKGDLVFDLGANRGLRSELFLELGARVIAVEPMPELAHLIRRRYPSRRLTIEPCAVGDEPGTATLHVGIDDLHSTISEDWVSSVRENPALTDRWAGALEVQVLTLDQLIDRHGLPEFMKMDIEGFELEALTGLSRAPRALSFEFQCAALDRALACLDLLDELGRYEYRVAGGEQFEYMEVDWATADQISDRLRRLQVRDPHTHGDVYARLADG
jgi:FkbM family methyltransferase